MDVSTLVASAGISAVVGTVVSLLAIPQATVRARRATAREQSREAVVEAVAPMQDELARYRFADLRTTARRSANGPLDLEDLEKLIRVRGAASDLRWWRRRLIDRRLRTVFGRYLLSLARDYPGTDSFSAWLGSSMNEARKQDALQLDVSTALIHRTYSEPPNKGPGKALARELRIIRRGGL